MTPVEKYTANMKAEIADDATVADRTVKEWRRFYSETVSEVTETTFTRKTLFDILGPSRTESVLQQAAETHPFFVDQLKVSEGGVNLAHSSTPDFLTDIVADGILTEAEALLIQAQAFGEGPRWQLRGLTKPNESTLSKALKGVAA